MKLEDINNLVLDVIVHGKEDGWGSAAHIEVRLRYRMGMYYEDIDSVSIYKEDIEKIL